MATLVLAATALATVWIAGYLTLCQAAPFAPCRHCDATGREPTSRGLRRDCRRCHGHRIHLRTGRRLLNHLRRLHKEGTR